MKKLVSFLLALVLLPIPRAPAQCVVPANGYVLKSASYSPLAADIGKTFVMNCASACTLTLPEHQAGEKVDGGHG